MMPMRAFFANPGLLGPTGQTRGAQKGLASLPKKRIVCRGWTASTVYFFQTQVKSMNKFKMSQIRDKSALYYAVGIGVFSAFFFVVLVIAELVSRNS
jgi:hypothetical protein